jgi:hypothetical protein
LQFVISYLSGRDLTEEEEAGIEKRLQSYIDEEVNRGYFPTRENILIFRENERRRILGQDLGAPPRVWLSKSTQTPTPTSSRGPTPNPEEADDPDKGPVATSGKRTRQKSTADRVPRIKIVKVQDGLGYLHMPPESASTTASGTPSPFQEGGKKTGKLVVSY